MIKFLSKNRLSILVLIFILLSSTVAYSQTYSIKKYVIGSTSETVSNADNKINSTLGEPAIGKTENANYKINCGFWFPQEQQEYNINIPFNAGWNIISSYINPENSNIEEIFSGMDNLVIVKNGNGQIYNPNQGINQIGDWNILHGYMVYVTSPATLEISGTAIVPNETQINLVAGWNLIAYLRNSQMSIETALGSISNSIVLVKDNQGKLYYPGFYLNTIGNMQPGKGYWFYMNAPTVLTYPGN